MCAVSFIGDQYHDRFRKYPWYPRWPDPNRPNSPPWDVWPGIVPYPQPVKPDPIDFGDIIKKNINDKDKVSKKDFDKLVKLVKEMKKDLEKARQQDIVEGAPDCEMEEKVRVVKAVAEAVGVDLGDVFPEDKE